MLIDTIVKEKDQQDVQWISFRAAVYVYKPPTTTSQLKGKINTHHGYLHTHAHVAAILPYPLSRTILENVIDK